MRVVMLRCHAILLVMASAGGMATGKDEDLARTLGRSFPSRTENTTGASGGQVEEHAAPMGYSREMTLTLPEGWRSTRKGNDLVITRDGVFLEHVLVERIRVDQVDPSNRISLTQAISPQLWRVRTIKYMTRRFTPGMSAVDAAEVILASRANNPGLTELRRREVRLEPVSGQPGFRATFDFRLEVQGRRTPYRTVYCGFMLDEWFYGISYTAASRYYFERGAGDFEKILLSVKLADEPPQPESLH